MKAIKITNCTVYLKRKQRVNQNVTVLFKNDDIEINEDLLNYFIYRGGKCTAGNFHASKTSKIIPCG
jgi:hypothetical protein